MNSIDADSDIKYRAYHVQAFMEQYGCGKNCNSSYIVSQITLENTFKVCEEDISNILEEFKIWYLLAGRYLKEPDDFPF
jgi:hypothetical protein